MTREQAEQIAAKHFGDALPHYIADWVVPAIMEAAAIERADEREACADVCESFDACDTSHIAKAIRARGNE